MSILVLLLLSLPATLIAFGETRFTGVVTDSAGTPIANAMVLIQWDSAGSTVGVTDNIVIKQDLVTRTDAVGTFSLELPPGFYDVFATAPAFTPTCRKVRIQAGKVEEIKFRMDAEPLYTAEMGNRVEALPPDSHFAPISKFVPPSYPPLARQAGISGQATITLEVNREGVITATRVESSTHPMFAQEAKRCVEKWSFVTDSRQRRLSVTFYFGFTGAPVEMNPKTTVTVDSATSSVRVYLTSNP
ncbi:MAG TPA: TonB family protein, partial [Bryobacteraceae bacterium]|nr:TonB family protein [Bryobacteraceae bacterium]